MRRWLNALLVPNTSGGARTVTYEVRPRPRKPTAAMAEIWVDGVYVCLVHRKVHFANEADPPDPKRWRASASAPWYVLRHGETHYCDDCPADKRSVLVSDRPKERCPPGERCL